MVERRPQQGDARLRQYRDASEADETRGARIGFAFGGGEGEREAGLRLRLCLGERRFLHGGRAGTGDSEESDEDEEKFHGARKRCSRREMGSVG